MAALAGKIALVTGGTKRIGREICRVLAAAGAHVVIHYRQSEDDAEVLCRELEAQGVRAWRIQADLERPEQSKQLFAGAVSMAGSVDLLVNNASLYLPSSFQDLDFRDLMRHVQVNAWAPYEISRAMARNGTAGSIVNILDSQVWGYNWSHLAYILSKRMFAALTDMMALKFAPRLRVNSVAPGPILPPAGKGEDYLENVGKTLPLERHGNPGHIAEAVLYLLQADFVTGEVIFVDGGQHLMEHRSWIGS